MYQQESYTTTAWIGEICQSGSCYKEVISQSGTFLVRSLFSSLNLQVLVKDRGRTLQNLYMNCKLKKNDEQGREILSLEPQHKNDLESWILKNNVNNSLWKYIFCRIKFVLKFEKMTQLTELSCVNEWRSILHFVNISRCCRFVWNWTHKNI